MPSKKHLIKKSLVITGHSTSVALEREYWGVLEKMAAQDEITIAALITAIDFIRPPGHPLTSALRVAVLNFLLENEE